jgi:rubrerythrin
MKMSIEKALKTAIEFEARVRQLYEESQKQAQDPIGKRVFGVLVNEEQGHLDYLNSRLKEWQKTGTITHEGLKTAIPSKKAILQEVDKLEGKVKEHDLDRHHNSELRMLHNALEVERETSTFYKKMVSDVPKEGRELFSRFVEIEEGHLAIVQAEIDYLSGPGYWFDFKEFDLAGG